MSLVDSPQGASLVDSHCHLDSPGFVERLPEVLARAKAAGIDEVVFDRGGYTYGGRIAALADAAREGGLKF